VVLIAASFPSQSGDPGRKTIRRSSVASRSSERVSATSSDLFGNSGDTASPHSTSTMEFGPTSSSKPRSSTSWYESRR
jgi:hypothetical protein